MSVTTVWTRQLGIDHPIIQAPMAGGADAPDLVAAVSNSGAIGFFGGSYMSPEQIAATAAAVRARTSRPFGINLFAPLPPDQAKKNPENMLVRLRPYYTELGLPAPTLPELPKHSFEDQLKACLDTEARCFSFTFGKLAQDAIQAIKSRGMLIAGTATTVAEAQELEKCGVDAIVAQGSEAGGHRGTFTGDFASGMVGLMALVPQVVDAVRIPVIASGGIMDGRGMVAALSLGACAVQMGTAFLTCDEAGVPEVYKQALLNAHEDQTRVTRAFSGRPARGIVNRFMTEMESDHGEDAILSFALQNALTRPLRTAAAKQGHAEFLSLWAGQGVRMSRRQPAAEFVARLVRECAVVLSALPRNETVVR